MSQPGGAKRYKILGRGWGPQRVYLYASDAQEAETRARTIAAMPGQSPVVVIDTARSNDGKAVTFYFANGEVL
jgi:hypothetical protein